MAAISRVQNSHASNLNNEEGTEKKMRPSYVNGKARFAVNSPVSESAAIIIETIASCATEDQCAAQDAIEVYRCVRGS